MSRIGTVVSPGPPRGTSPFSETLVSERSPVFTLSSVSALSMLRNVVPSGAPTHTGEEYRLLAGDVLESSEIGNYVPGFAAEVGVGVRVGTAPDGAQVMRWGYFDSTDGFFFELTTDGLFAVVRRNSVDVRTPQTSWNVNTITGVGLDDGLIFQIRFTWYGYGQIEFQLVDTNVSGVQRVTVLHRVVVAGETSVRNPNLPIRAENIGPGSGQLFLAGRQFSIIGKYTAQERTHSIVRTLAGVTTAWTPIVAFRRQDNENARRTRLHVEGVSIRATADCQMAVVLNPTITFGTAVAPDLASTSQTVLDWSVDPSAFSIGSGQATISDLIATSGTNSTRTGSGAWAGLDVPVARRQPAVLVVRALSATTDVTCLLRSREEW